VTFYCELVGLAPLAVAAALVWRHAPSGSSLAWGAGAGAIGAAGIALLYRGLAVGAMSVVAPITAVCATAIPVLAGFGLGERPTMRALIGVGAAITAVLLVSTAHGAPDGVMRSDDGPPDGAIPVERRAAVPVERRRRGVALALVSGTSIGGFLVLIARAQGNGLWPLLVSRAVATTVLAALALATGSALIPASPVRRTVVWAGLLDTAATVCYATAVHPGALGIVATLISLYPASTVLLARVVLKERLAPQQTIGLVLAGGAVALMTAG